MIEKLLELVRGRQGHFQFECGHHGDLWLELERLCMYPREIQAFAA
jgi:orotate phosphoribosyltransferase